MSNWRTKRIPVYATTEETSRIVEHGKLRAYLKDGLWVAQFQYAWCQLPERLPKLYKRKEDAQLALDKWYSEQKFKKPPKANFEMLPPIRRPDY